jgi:putative glutamine amidotransferase
VHAKNSGIGGRPRARPRVGITGTNPAQLKNYIEAVEAAGAEAVPLYSDAPRPPEEVLGSLDALVLSGGDDIDPAEYGEPARDGMQVNVDAARDALELPLTRLALGRDLPVLGICRGIQTLNVALGGTLHQDVVEAGLARNSHQQRTFTPPPPEDAAVHPVQITPQSRLQEIAGTRRLDVNTFHHQAVDRVAPDLVVTARSVEQTGPGLIEAVEMPSRRFVVAVQWHPERMWKRGGAAARLFAAFVGAASRARVG